MKTSQGLYLSAFFLLMGSGCILTASCLFTKFSHQTISNPCRMLPSLYVSSNMLCPSLQNNLQITRRTKSTFYNDRNLTPLTVHRMTSAPTIDEDQWGKLARYEELFINYKLLLQKFKHQTGSSKWENEESVITSKHLNRALNEIVPFNQKKTTFSPIVSDTSSSLHSEEADAPEGQVAASNEEKKISINPINAAQYQCVSKSKNHVHCELINRVMNTVDNSDTMLAQELGYILDLYTTLVLLPKKAITKVLVGQTNSNTSYIYREVEKHINEKHSDIEVYRKMYARLREVFGKEVMQLVYRVIENILQEQKPIVGLLTKKEIDKDQQYYISTIANYSHPLYPVEPNEVKAILELYASLSKIPRKAITKVLISQTDSSKSYVYQDVQNHIIDRGSNIQMYRKIYAHVKKALHGKGILLVYRLLDSEKKI